MTDSLPPVSRTALGVAGLRATESGRPDRLFDDPYASLFFEAGKSLLPAPPQRAVAQGPDLRALFYSQVVVRTRFYDEYLTGAVAQGCAQVVLLAAGLDSRALRLDWPASLRLFELDLPGVLEFKDRVLTEHGAVPRCTRVVVPVDLREDWACALREAGFDPARPTAWLAEGLLIYLSFEEAAGLLGTVGELSAPGGRIAFEHRADLANPLVSSAKLLERGRSVTDLWQGGLGKEDERWLAEHGWRPSTHVRPPLARERGGIQDEPHGFLTAIRAGSARTERSGAGEP